MTETGGKKRRIRVILFALQYLATILSVLFAVLLALGTYVPTQFPIGFSVFFVHICVVNFLIVILAKHKIKRKDCIITLVSLILICVFLPVNQGRYAELNKSYLSGNTYFTAAARKVMPELPQFPDAEKVEHFHGHRLGDEWVVLKVVLSPEDYPAAVAQERSKIHFYTTDEVISLPYNELGYESTPSTFYHNGYRFDIIDLSAYGGIWPRYTALFATNEVECSITYLFLDSIGTYGGMSLDKAVAHKWPDLGMSTGKSLP